MKAAYTGWTWITNREPEAAKNQLKQAFQECKFLGYDTVENFAFIRDYYADDPQALVDLTKECGVDLVNLYGPLHLRRGRGHPHRQGADRLLRRRGRKVVQLPERRLWRRRPLRAAHQPRNAGQDVLRGQHRGRLRQGEGRHPCASTPTTAPACSGRATSITSPSTPIPTTSPSALTPPTPPWPAWTPAALIRQYGSRVAYMHLKAWTPTPCPRPRAATRWAPSGPWATAR